MSELFPARSIAVEVIVCTDPAREAEFNYWHDKVRIPRLRQRAGIVDVYRYRDVQPDYGDEFKRFKAPPGGTTRYLTIYRINDPDPWALAQRLRDEEMTEASLIDCAQVTDLTVWDFCAVRQTLRPPDTETRLPDGMPEAFFLYYSNHDPAHKVDHDDWWLYTHAHDLLETPGLVQCSRYQTLNPQPAVREAKIMQVYEIGAEDPSAVLLRVLQDDRDIRRPQGRFSSFGIEGDWHGTGLYRHWDLM
ncbi:MAG: hypothetical protein ACRDQ1_08545 [Sciscionella sp.]